MTRFAGWAIGLVAYILSTTVASVWIGYSFGNAAQIMFILPVLLGGVLVGFALPWSERR